MRFKLLSLKCVNDALDVLAKVPEYVVPLQMINVPEGPGHKLYESLLDAPGSIIGKAPNNFDMMENCANIPSPLSSLNGKQLCRLYQFLGQNGSYKLIPTSEDGDCAYSAFRKCTTLPYEVADVHVRRLVVKGLCNNHKFFFDLFKRSIAMTYGLSRDSEEELQRKIAEGSISAQDLREQRLPGPFSFIGFLKHMLNNSTYADTHILMTMSMMWNLRLTVVYAETLREIRYRHHKRLAQADMVFVVSSETEHFVSAGKRLYLFRKRLWFMPKRLW